MTNTSIIKEKMEEIHEKFVILPTNVALHLKIYLEKVIEFVSSVILITIFLFLNLGKYE